MKRCRCKGREEQWDKDLILGFGFYLAFGVEGELLIGGGVGSGERRLNVLSAGGKNELAEFEAEDADTSELAGGLGLSDGSNHGCAYGDGDGVIRIVDGFGDGSFDLLART